MTDSSINPETNFFKIRSSLSNEHLLFADTLRDWTDPLLHGHEAIPVPLCPRCATCKCESLKDLPNPELNLLHHHHHIHDSSCPNFRHSRRINRQSKRRAISHDPSIDTSSSSSSIIKSLSAEHSPLNQSIQRNRSTSKIPVRISTSDYSPSSSISFHRLSNKKTKNSSINCHTKFTNYNWWFIWNR